MKKRLIVIFFLLLITIIFVFVRDRIKSPSPMQVVVNEIKEKYEDEYIEYMVLESYGFDKEDKEIHIIFELNGNSIKDKVEIISFLYEKVYEEIFVQETLFEKYSLQLGFQNDVSGGKSIYFSDINKSKDKISVVYGTEDEKITIQDVAKICPEVSNLSIGNLEYDTLEDFDAFTNLEYVWFMGIEANEEVENYILSRFPDCHIIWKEN